MFLIELRRQPFHYIFPESNAGGNTNTIGFATPLLNVSALLKISETFFLAAAIANNNLTFITEDVYKIPGPPPLSNTTLTFSVLGKVTLKPIFTSPQNRSAIIFFSPVFNVVNCTSI